MIEDQALAIGFVRGTCNENEDLERFILDIQNDVRARMDDIVGASANFVVLTQDQITNGCFTELEEMYQQGKLHIQRVVSNPDPSQTSSTIDERKPEMCQFHQSGRPLKLGALESGLLNPLKFVDDDTDFNTPLDKDEVEISVQAISVNSNDVMVAYGLLKPTLGEFSGIITKVGTNFRSQYQIGDRVSALSFTPYASLTRTNGHLLHHLPAAMTYSTAASLPLAFITAHHSLVDTANLSSDQTILIHAADSPLGQAAIAVAQHIGAAIFATVSSDSGAALVNRRNGLLESYMFDRRSSQFVPKIMQHTQVGVDVVFNPPSEDALRGSLECIAPFGTLVCVGEAQASRPRPRPVNLDSLGKKIVWEEVDMDEVARGEPRSVQALLETVFGHIEAGDYTSWPITVVSLPDIGNAFRMTQAGTTFPKIVLDAGEDVRVGAVTRPLRLQSDATYVVVGRLGNLDAELGAFVRACGARHVVVLSKRGFDAEARASIEQEMAARQLSVKVASGDEVSVREMIESLGSC